MDLRHFIRVYEANLEPGFCSGLVANFHALSAQHRDNGAGRNSALAQSAWTELDVGQHSDAGFLGYFRQRMTLALAQYNADTGLAPLPVPNSPRSDQLILKRYRPGGAERFQPHFDAVGGSANRYLVFLWYLNDVVEGGETVFPQLGMSVPARTGSLLMFPPYWMYQHAGTAPASGDKYILSTYLLF